MTDTMLAAVGIVVKEPWADDISYEMLNYTLWRVQDGGDGCGYVALKNNFGVRPDSDPTTWRKAVEAGQSIYDLAVKYGHFIGTEEEFEAQYQAALAAANNAAAAASETNTQIQQAEAGRVAAEQARETAESGRSDAEIARASAETGRISAENARNDAETIRDTNETSRVRSEAGRVTAESGRVSAEQGRAAAEQTRTQQFEALEQEMRTAIGQADAATATALALNEQVQVAARVSAEQARVSAESARVSAESARVSAETARETQAGNDHTRAESDHSTAASDHTTAGLDHTHAGTDHTRAEGDHTQAGADHTQSVADHTASEAATTAANTAAAAADAAREGIQDELDQKANKDGYYGGMTVGSAENLVGRGTVEAEYGGVRTSAGTADIGSGSAAIARMKGRSFVWNQLYNTEPPTAISDHKYLISEKNSGTVSKSISTSISYTADSTERMCIDLTLLFGAGNEPSTAEEFDAWRKEMGLTLDYYAYNLGEVINNKAAGILTRGFNLYNPSTGKAFLPGPYSDYPHEYEICGTFSSISFTDINGNTSVPTLTDGKFFNVDAPGELTVVGGNNTDTLVHLVWSGWRNEGEPDYAFEPYWENTLNLNLTQLTGKLNGAGESVVVFPNGLAKIGDVQDEIVGNKAIKRIGVVDLGTLGWQYSSADSRFFAAVNAAHTVGNDDANMICAKYPVLPFAQRNFTYPGFTFDGVSNKTLQGRNFTNTSAADFKSAMSGVLLYYELATPQEYILDTTPDWNYRVDDFGTEQVLPSYDPSNLTAPISYDVQYAMNAVDAIRRLPDNYVERSDVKQTIGQSEKHVLSQKGVDANYAKKVGVENDLVAGAAKALAGNQRQVKEFSTMVMDGADGIAKINEAMGKSLVWNQNVKNGDFSDGMTNWSTEPLGNVTASVADNTLTLVNDGTSTGNVYSQQITDQFVVGHKYYFAVSIYATFQATSGTNDRILFWGNLVHSMWPSELNKWERFSKIVNTTGGIYHYVRAYCGLQGTAKYRDFQLFDLTQMFGAGNEPSTVEEFEKLFPLPYYEYNAGTIISNKTQSLEIRDADEELKETMPLNLSTITGKLNGEGESVVIFPDGMRSAGTVYDSLLVDEDGYARKAVKRMGSVDLGTLTWTRQSSAGAYFFRGAVTGMAQPGTTLDRINGILCEKYPVDADVVINENSPDKTIRRYEQNVFIRDDSYSDATTFTTAMSGVYLIYELETPETYDLDEPIPMTFMAYHGGTITQTPQAPESAPMRMNVTFALDAVSTINGLPQNYVSKESLQAMLAAMQSAGIFSSYTMSFNSTSGKYEFTFTVSNS